MGDIAQLEKEKRRAEKKDNLREVASLCNLLGQEYMKDGDYDEALSQHREEAAISEALGDTIGVSVANRRMGEVYCEMGKFDKALHHQNRYLSLAKEVGSHVEQQRAYATLGRTHLQRAEVFVTNGQLNNQDVALTEAERAFLRSLATCEQLQGSVDTQEHSQMRCRLFLNLGLVLECRQNDRKARHFIGQALDLCSKHSFHEDAYRCHSALFGILFRLGKLSEALIEGQNLLKLAAKLRDKELQCESHNFLAQVHLANSDYDAAKKCYYKAYKLKHPSLEERKRIERHLKVAVSLCGTEDALILATDDQNEEKLKLYDSLGDGLSKLNLFSKALEYYRLMLELALKLHKDASFLAPIYLSLAQTYSDNKQYEEAKEYYLKEYDIKIHEDPSDACKTLLSVAVVCENKGDDYQQLEDLYTKARAAAVRADSKKLEHKVLHMHSGLTGIPEDVKVELEEEMKAIAETSGFDPEAESSEEECDSDDDIDLDLVNFSDSEEEQANFDRPRQARQKKVNIVKRNEKGETALHKACISGNLKMVKKLILQGHPINPRDNCGWLPLHEAANHGFFEIVSELLDAGAWINDRGGKQCEGVTPLHDAAACGNLQVVRLLISRGASVIVKDNYGTTPLESLVNFRNRSNLSSGEQQECADLEEELKEMMTRTGHKVPEVANKVSQKEIRSSSSGSRKLRRDGELSSSSVRHSSRKVMGTGIEFFGNEPEELPDLTDSPVKDSLGEPVALDESFALEDNDSEEFFNPLLQDVQQETMSATGEYLSAIGSVGSAAKRSELQATASSSSFRRVTKNERKNALVTEVEDVGDNWLDDDLGIFNKKRKRTEKFEFEFREPRKERKIQQEKKPLQKPSSRVKKSFQPKLTSMVQKNSELSRDDDFTVINTSESAVTPSSSNLSNPGNQANGIAVASSVNGSPTNLNGGNTAAVAGSGALRLRVRVQNRLLLVPVAGGGQGRTVEWLASEVTRRYYQLAGLRPHLTLTTQDGAVLDPNDPIDLVLPLEQAELQAQVTGWDLPPLTERYSQACQSMGVSPVPCLTSVLHQTEASTSLDLSRMGRLTTQLYPVLRALQCQQSLHTMILANIHLGDDGFGHLMEALPTLPSLEVLNLRCSSLTTSSLLSFTEAVTSGGLTLKALASLDMSYNHFSGAKVSDVSALFTIPSLSILSLKHCHLSLSGQHQLPASPSGIKKLELDYNTIYDAPLTGLLSQVSQVSHLSLSGLNCRNNIEVKVRLGLALASILGAGEECKLEYLDLSSCGLTDLDLEDISAYLYRCPHLSSINLSHNHQLTSASVSTLLNELTLSVLLPLKSLSLHGIKTSPDVHAKLSSAVQRKAAQQKILSNLSVTQPEKENMLEGIWKSHNPKTASVMKIGSELFLSC